MEGGAPSAHPLESSTLGRVATHVEEGRPASPFSRAEQPATTQQSQGSTRGASDLLAGCKHFAATSLIKRGAFALVLRGVDVRRPAPAELAFKLLPRGGLLRAFRSHVHREIVHQSSMRHPMIVAIKEVFLTPTHLGVAMELASGGDLQGLLSRSPGGRLGEEDARWLFQQCVIALDYCHRREAGSRDLRLDNILLDGEGNARLLVKLCDFGYHKHALSSEANTRVPQPGAVAYLAPEVVLSDAPFDAKASDVWSLGVILYVMLYGSFPFDASSPRSFARQLATAHFTPPPHIPVSSECKAMLYILLAHDPQRRPSTREVARHPWFQRDLPEGAWEMNSQLLQQEPAAASLEEAHFRVGKLLDQALEVGFPGEPVVSVEF